MGKKKTQFINKKASTTYSLTYGGGVDVQDDVSQGGFDETSADGSEFSPYHDRSYVLSAARRKELMDLGFPDDGYDYLAHLKELGPQKKKPVGPPHASSTAAAAASTSAEPLPSRKASEACGIERLPHEGGEEGTASEGEDEDVATGTGPSVFVAGKFVPPNEDVKLLDARRLVVQSKVQDDAAADEAAASVSALARVHSSKVTRGRLLHDLVELEESMALVEAKNERPGKLEGFHAARRSETQGHNSTVIQIMSKDGEDGSDEDDWEEWFDDFVVTAAREDPAISEAAEGLEEEEEQRQDEARTDRGSGGCRAASVASSYLRPERQDRKGELGLMDDRFEKLATQYEDEASDGEEAAKSRNCAKISDYAHLLDEFLVEQAEMETQNSLKLGQGCKEAVAHDGGDFAGVREHVGMHSLGGSDEEDGPRAASRSSGENRGRNAAGPALVHRKLQALDEVDPEVITKTRELIAAAEAEAAKREELAGHGAAGGGGLLGEAGDLFNENLEQVFVERDDRWDCESVLSLRSNLDNHPARIAEPQRRAGTRSGGPIRLSSKSGIPAAYAGGALAAGVPTLKAITGQDAAEGGPSAGEDSPRDVSDAGNAREDGAFLVLDRRKDETAEEKRARKASVKEAQREARAAKKALRTMFKEEGAKQRRQAAGRHLGAPEGGSTYVIA